MGLVNCDKLKGSIQSDTSAKHKVNVMMDSISCDYISVMQAGKGSCDDENQAVSRTSEDGEHGDMVTAEDEFADITDEVGEHRNTNFV